MDYFLFYPIAIGLVYLVIIAAFFYAIFNISKNSNRHTQLLHDILNELRNPQKDK